MGKRRARKTRAVKEQESRQRKEVHATTTSMTVTDRRAVVAADILALEHDLRVTHAQRRKQAPAARAQFAPRIEELQVALRAAKAELAKL